MSKRPDGHGPLKWMANFKSIQIDYEYYLTLSDEPKAVCLSERQMYVLSVQNSYTYWGTRWYNTDDVSEAQLKLIAAEIEDLLMCGCGTPEPSITDRFTANTYMTTTNTFYEETYNTWNDAGQTVISIAPNLDFGTGVPADIDKLLCLNINMFVQTVIEAAIAYKKQTTQEKKDITKNLASIFAALASAGGAAIAAGGILALGMAFLGGPLTVFGLAMAAVGLFIANVVETTDLSVFEDPEAVEKIRCTLTENMTGEQLTRARFQAGLTPNHFSPGSNAAKLKDIFQPYLDDLNVYLQFLVTGNGLYDAVDVGALPECEVCPIPQTCFDFEEDRQDWTAPSPADAQWTHALGWGRITSGYVTIDSPQDGTVIHTVKIRFYRPWANTSDFERYFVNLYDWGGSGNFQTTLGGGLSHTQEITIENTTGTDWTDLRVQIAAGGYTWPIDQFIAEVCYIGV